MLESCIIMKVQSCLLSGKYSDGLIVDYLQMLIFFGNQLPQLELQWHNWLGTQGLRVNPGQEHFVVCWEKCTAILTVFSYSLNG